ncbi:MAG: ParA family partition ATPase [Silicimonas sp.]|jgi:chromosome partitioning protein|uniref:ParA family partition ATPase n=1 Tax=Roseitalea porphyridii TaxID=1852022 RepID=UPI0032EB3936
MILGFLNQKGGVGKTTLATHVAGELARTNARVLLIDADPQASALDWSERRVGEGLPRLFDVVGLAKETLHDQVPSLSRGYDHVVIDGPPRVTALARSAMLASDLVLIPVQPSPYDVWASQQVVTLVTEARIFRPELRAAFLVNRRIVNTVIGRDVHEALSELGMPALSVPVSQRVAFAESVAIGRLVRESHPESAAAKEIAAVASEIMNGCGR